MTTGEQVLQQLDHLATVEHSLCDQRPAGAARTLTPVRPPGERLMGQHAAGRGHGPVPRGCHLYELDVFEANSRDRESPAVA
jgi:hypothetical protein